MSATRRYKSSVPDIVLPSLHGQDWKDVSRILCVDESLNDSGAALFVDGKYTPVHKNNTSVGLYLTLSRSSSQMTKVVAYDRWIRSLISEHKPHVVILESHPFMRGNAKTSIATLEVLVGVRYIAMVACGTLGVPYAEFSTNSVKTIICGASSASKESVQMILSACGYDLPKYEGKDVVNDNVCDAIAMGEVICRMQKQELLRREYTITMGRGRAQTRSRLHPNKNAKE